jgi:hypothetical protein
VEHQVLEVRQEQMNVCIEKDNLEPDFFQSHHDPFSTYNTFGIYFGQDSCDLLWPTKNFPVQSCDQKLIRQKPENVTDQQIIFCFAF